MKLKIKFLEWSAGFPVAMLNKKTAQKLGVHAQDRISIRTFSKRPKEITTIVDIVNKIVKRDEIAVTSELKRNLDLKKGQNIEVSLAETPESLISIKKKLNKEALSREEIEAIIRDIVYNSLSEAEIALFVSAMYKSGMLRQETIYLIDSILKFGNNLSLGNKLIADKHSIGGVAGNRTTPIVVSICAAAGLTVPKNSSRAITSAAGTADVIEAIARVEFSIKELKKIIKKTNACMVWGGAWGSVPADSKIIAVEKILNIDPEAQLLASIIAKKLSAGSKYVIIDIPCGKFAKVDKSKALRLKKKFEYLGRYYKIKLKAVLTDGSQPIGNGIGPVLELIDVVKILDPEQKGPRDLEDKSIFLAGQLLELTGKAKKREGAEMAKRLLDSGKAFEKFKQIITAQKGDIRKIKELKPAKFKKDILAEKSGDVYEIDNKKINFLARVAGCPLDKSSGVYLYFHVGEKIKRHQKILTIFSDSKSRLKQAIKFYRENTVVVFK